MVDGKVAVKSAPVKESPGSRKKGKVLKKSLSSRTRGESPLRLSLLRKIVSLFLPGAETVAVKVIVSPGAPA